MTPSSVPLSLRRSFFYSLIWNPDINKNHLPTTTSWREMSIWKAKKRDHLPKTIQAQPSLKTTSMGSFPWTREGGDLEGGLLKRQQMYDHVVITKMWNTCHTRMFNTELNLRVNFFDDLIVFKSPTFWESGHVNHHIKIAGHLNLFLG